MKKTFLIEVILTNQCNKRCEYCDLDFRSTSLSRKDINSLIAFLQENSNKVEMFHINFFGGEPLLLFLEIQYFVENIAIDNITFSLGTNGLLLGNTHLKFFKKHAFRLYLSIDNIDGSKILTKNIFEGYQDMIHINFINDPDFLFFSKNTLDSIINSNFTNINVMPVFTSKRWSQKQLISFGTFIKNIPHYGEKEIKYFSYYNGISSDIQFILDTDMNFYADIDSLIWLQKQYSVVPKILKTELHEATKIGSLMDNNITIDSLEQAHNVKNLYALIMKIPKLTYTFKDMCLLNSIIKIKR